MSPDDLRYKIDVFVRRRFNSAFYAITKERKAACNALRERLAALGEGLVFDPIDPRFDEIELNYCKAQLQAKSAALFEAYDVYGVVPDELILRELGQHAADLVAGRGHALLQEASGWAVRTGRNSGPARARAKSLGREIARSTHAVMQSLSCEIEKRKQAKIKSNSTLKKHLDEAEAKSSRDSNPVPSSDMSDRKTERMPSTVYSPAAVGRIEEFLAKNGLNQTQFGTRANTTDRTIRKIRNTAIIKKSMLASIAQALGITTEDLLRE